MKRQLEIVRSSRCGSGILENSSEQIWWLLLYFYGNFSGCKPGDIDTSRLMFILQYGTASFDA
jgi:hypothetical protein